ncbi:V2 [Horseradish curly top virus]|uniref:V2 protein n=1 Tax=Horseradish curly top virus TaxID=46448 RepID=Q68540_9GEMI|nr:hypothetical protein [Horseradish curly top virus]AAB18923.1 V2 [Horseradish curly top virus]
MGPFTVGQFPRNYPALLAVSTSCFFRYNKWCILGIRHEVESLTLEEGEAFLGFQKEVKKLLKRKCTFSRKCELYEEIYKKYLSDGPEEKGSLPTVMVEEEEDWAHEKIPMEEACSQDEGPEIEDV